VKQISSIAEMNSLSAKWRQAGERIGLVPTMGYFHNGHLALMQESVRQCDKTVVSLFVNPIQFGPKEDLETYPRDLDRDREMAHSQGVDVLYHPDVKDMYPQAFQTSIHVDRLTEGLCGGKRPGHFDGVCTVVNKLFNQVRPHMAIFGEKDFQQLAVIRRMVTDLDIGIKIVGYPTVREQDGLAMSSRNSYLDREQRQKALCLSQAIQYAREKIAANRTTGIRQLEQEIKSRIESEDGFTVDYVSIVDGDSLIPCDLADENSILLLAVYVDGSVRLIDNGKLIL